jgi:hypothetical protein
MVSTPY